jgi:hypothetical protein
MNWGYKIILGYVVFVSGIVFMVVKSSMQNTDLVTPDYYEQELKYQTVIDATLRANNLSSLVKCSVANDSLLIQFPPEMKNAALKADLWLYCIANKKRDVRKTLQTTEGIIQLPLTAINKGMHDVKLNWQVAGKTYYYEQKIFLQ